MCRDAQQQHQQQGQRLQREAQAALDRQADSMRHDSSVAMQHMTVQHDQKVEQVQVRLLATFKEMEEQLRQQTMGYACRGYLRSQGTCGL